MELIFKIYVPQIISENTYLAAGKTRTGRPYLYKKAEVSKYQNDIVNSLCYKDDVENFLKSLPDQFYLKTDYTFYLKSQFNRRDLTNMKKLVEDAIIRYFNSITSDTDLPNIDDSMIIQDTSRKIEGRYLLDENLAEDSELIIIKISVFN